MSWRDRSLEEFDHPTNMDCHRCHREIELKPHYRDEDDLNDDLYLQGWFDNEDWGWICGFCESDLQGEKERMVRWKTDKITPLPWYADENTANIGGNRFLIAHCYNSPPSQVDSNKANAAYIVHAANLYPELVEALKQTRDAAAAFMRVLYRHEIDPEEITAEAEAAGVKPGFGKRADDLIAKAEGGR